jgi:DNA-binding transcriptional MerR regulator
VAYRIEELAEKSGVSVETIRFYQHRGLLQRPIRQGRTSIYDDEHAARLARIRELQAKGFTLSTIRRLVAGELDAADEALIEAVSEKAAHSRPKAAGAAAGEEPEVFDLDELAQRSGIPAPLLTAAVEAGLLPVEWGGFNQDDVEAAKAGLQLLQEGVPLDELLSLARTYDAQTKQVAERAVELFDSYIRKPLRDEHLADKTAATRLVDAFQRMLPATTTLITHHFRRTLLATALSHIESVGDDEELAAVREAGGDAVAGGGGGR